MENPEHIGCINPLRYRGYYYDQETGLYYLNARYYDPETGRFINADNEDFILENNLNLFSYCKNNPVMGYDPSGNIDPKSIRFSQKSISPKFSAKDDPVTHVKIPGLPLLTMIMKLRAREITPMDLPLIRVVSTDTLIDRYEKLEAILQRKGRRGKRVKLSYVKTLGRGILFTLDNRRLYCYQQAGISDIPFVYAKWSEIKDEIYKFNTFGHPELEDGRTINVND